MSSHSRVHLAVAPVRDPGRTEPGRTRGHVGSTTSLALHRELSQLYVAGNIVVVQLALQGTNNGPLITGGGTLEPTGNRMDAPCCDVFELENGKIKRFDCYPSGTVILAQLGVLGALDAAVRPSQ